MQSVEASRLKEELEKVRENKGALISKLQGVQQEIVQLHGISRDAVNYEANDLVRLQQQIHAAEAQKAALEAQTAGIAPESV